VLALAEANIAFGIRERTVARGLDPSELALVAAGGAGPILACGIAEILELREIIVPPRPGLLAAWGLLVAPERREAAMTVLKPIHEITPSAASEYFERALKQLPKPPDDSARQYLTAALRYLGQGFEVEVEVDDPGDIQEIERRFHAAHEHEYGFAMPASPVEWVELRAAWEIAAQEWRFPDESVTPQGSEAQTPLWERRVSPKGTSKIVSVQASQWQRSRLALGDKISGSAIIIEHDATTYIPTGWQGEVTPGGYMRIRKVKATS
jgi:N-methylhydantoinase A/oxoprolinase/acetone carboxylase beta subunit